MIKKKDIIILGISYNSTAEAAIIKNGKIICAVAEERLNRVKNWYGIPRLSVDWVLKEAGISMKNVDFITTHDGTHLKENRKPIFESAADLIKKSGEIDDERKKAQLEILWKRYAHTENIINNRHIEYIKQIEGYGRPVKTVAHHLAHAASAYFTSGWNNCHALTADGWGSDASNGLYECRNGQIKEVASSSFINSLGYFYGSITKYLGFTPHKHEGKVLGLSGHGNPRKLEPFFKKMIGFDRKSKSFRGYMENGYYSPNFDNPWLTEALKNHSREDIAAGAQAALETVVLKYIQELIPQKTKLCLAGGIFANVLLNQKILALPNVSDIYVYPNMSDGGLAVGSALYAYSQIARLKPKAIDHVYWGPDYNDREIVTALNKYKLSYKKIGKIEKKIAELIAAGHVVARFNGKMENGPRALGNRSVIYKPNDPLVNDWLNKKLKRTEFMPFAPVTLAEHAQDCYHLIKNHVRPANFMTITCDCTNWMKKVSPGVIHVDGTARPQLISRSQNQSYYKIIKEFYKLTGNPTLINTSFNMHEEPIVCSPSDAIRAFLDAQLPYLAIGSYLIANNNQKTVCKN